MPKQFFQLKADFFPFTVLKIVDYDRNGLMQQLQETIQKAPQFLKGAPMVIDVQSLVKNDREFDITELHQTLKSLEIHPVGIRGLASKQSATAQAMGLALIHPSTNTKVVEPDPTQEKKLTKIITKPIRAGMKVYAPDGDLVIAASVNAGAECIAAGHIHVYGPLRGRALAGASGNTEAKIFAQQIDAELISIAGHYIVDVSRKKNDPASAGIQISLEEQTLKIEEI
jgi:septum site-determining protein MinC